MSADERIERRILFRDPRFYASFPSVATRADGVTLVAFRQARDHRWLRGADFRQGAEGFNHVDHLDSRSQTVLLTLGPEGEPLDVPQVLPPDPQAADQDASLLVLRDGRILLTGFCWYPVAARDAEALRALGFGLVGSPQKAGDSFLFWGGYARHSDDDGRRWTPRRFLPPVPGHPDIVPDLRPMHGGAVRGRAVEAEDGAVLQTTYTNDPRTGQYASLLFASTDRGESWTLRSTIAFDPEGKVGFCETSLHLDAMGGLTAFHRTTGLDDHLATSRSSDLGHSWEPWRRHDVIGHPYDACPLPDGRLLLSYGHRHPPFGVRARILDPAWLGRGPMIGDAPEILLRDDGPGPDLGYPWATLLPDGRAIVVYYLCDPTGVRSIEASLYDWKASVRNRSRVPRPRQGRHSAGATA